MLLPGFLSSRHLARLRKDVVDVYNQTSIDWRAGSASPERAGMFRYEMFNRSAQCQELIAHPGLLKVVEPLIGNDCHVIACTAWRNPDDTDHAPRGQEWHTDAGPHVPRAPDVPWPDNIPYPVFAICAHIYLDDCGTLDGPTTFIPRSHKSGLAPPKEREWDLDLEYGGQTPHECLAKAGDLALFVSDLWHRRLPPQEGNSGRFFLQINYARRDIAQRVLSTAEVNHTRKESRARAKTERERLLIGLHPECFYDG